MDSQVNLFSLSKFERKETSLAINGYMTRLTRYWTKSNNFICLLKASKIAHAMGCHWFKTDFVVCMESIISCLVETTKIIIQKAQGVPK